MKGQREVRLSGELEPLHQEALALANGELPRLLGDVAGDPGMVEELRGDPRHFLEGRGVRIPDELEVRFLDDLRGGGLPEIGAGMPGLDFEFFSIRLFNCRSYWLPKQDGEGYEKVEVCFGFEVVPVRPSWGPIG